MPEDDPFQTSPNFVNPAYVTPQQLLQMREVAQQLIGSKPTAGHATASGLVKSRQYPSWNADEPAGQSGSTADAPAGPECHDRSGTAKSLCGDVARRRRSSDPNDAAARWGDFSAGTVGPDAIIRACRAGFGITIPETSKMGHLPNPFRAMPGRMAVLLFSRRRKPDRWQWINCFNLMDNRGSEYTAGHCKSLGTCWRWRQQSDGLCLDCCRPNGSSAKYSIGYERSEYTCAIGCRHDTDGKRQTNAATANGTECTAR